MVYYEDKTLKKKVARLREMPEKRWRRSQAERLCRNKITNNCRKEKQED
jgi:hypothetical protein